MSAPEPLPPDDQLPEHQLPDNEQPDDQQPEPLTWLPDVLMPTTQRIDQFLHLIQNVVGAQSRFVLSAWELWTRATSPNDQSTKDDQPLEDDQPAGAELPREAEVPREDRATAEPSDPEPSDPEPSDPEPFDPEPSDADISARAYELYVQRGRQSGHEQEDWERARAELRGARDS